MERVFLGRKKRWTGEVSVGHTSHWCYIRLQLHIIKGLAGAMTGASERAHQEAIL